MIITKVISGGQTGADLAGLRAAVACGIATGGTAPRHFKTEDGMRPNLGKVYGLKESHSDDYLVRTKKNILDADITLVFGELTGGSKRTVSMCFSNRRPVFNVSIGDFGCNESVEETAQWVVRQAGGKSVVVNIAGNRESKCPGIGTKTRIFLIELFNLVNGSGK